MAKGKTTTPTDPPQPDTEPLPQQSAVDVEADVDVEHESHGHSDTDREVTVERTTEIDWTIDYGGDSPHPTRVGSEGYVLPPVQPESN